MSTRCNIIVTDYGVRHYLYHNSDGYPSGVGVQLKKCAKRWFPGGYGCRTWPSLVANQLVKYEIGLNDKTYEITSGLHGDVNYLYVINLKARTIRGYRVERWDMKISEIVRRENLVRIPEWDGSPTIYEKEKEA